MNLARSLTRNGIEAVAKAGFGFANWTENGSVVSTMAEYSFNATGDRELIANFTNHAPSVMAGFVLQSSFGQLRNDFNGEVGMRIRVGGEPIMLTALGRMHFAGNSGLHTVRVVRASDLVELSRAEVNLSGGTPGQFKYAWLDTPATLAANTVYHLVSSEAAGGDLWADYVETVLTVAALAEVQGAVYVGSGFPWTEVLGGPWSYGPCDFLYGEGASEPLVTVSLSAEPPAGGSVAGGGVYASGSSATALATANPGFVFAYWEENGSVISSTADYPFNAISNRTLVARFTNTVAGEEKAFVTSTSLGNLKYDGALAGFQFTVGPVPLEVTALARMCAPGNSWVHELKLMQADGTDVPGGTVSVNLAGGTPGEFVWAELAAPVSLQANSTYQLVSSESWFTDAYYDWTTTVTATSDAVCDSAGYSWFGWNAQGGANTARGPLNFRYRTQGAVLPAGAGGNGERFAGVALERDSAGVFFLYVTGEMGEMCFIESTTDLRRWTPFATVLLSEEQVRLEVSAEQAACFWRASATAE